MSFVSLEDETNRDNKNYPKFVDRTIRVSNITQGHPLRKPHFKDRNLYLVNYKENTQNSVKEMDSTALHLNKWDNSTDGFHFQKNECIETKIMKSNSPIAVQNKIISKEISIIKPDSLLIECKESEICKKKNALNEIKKENELEIAVNDSSGNEDIVKFLQKKLFAKCQFKFTGDENISFDHPVGVAELKSKKVIVADTFANRLLLFSEKGKFLHKIATSSVLKHPSAIVVLSDGKFAVRSIKGIAMFSPDCTFLKSFGSDFLKKPFGITEDGEGNLITVDTGISNVMSLVFINGTTGNLVKKLPVLNAIKPDEQYASKPRFITFRPPSSLLLVDLGLDKVYIIDLKTGEVVRSFGSSGNGIGQFRDPSGIACEADGFILVGDSRNHRIQIFTPCGDFVCVLRLDRPLRRPSGISLTPDGSLLVLNYWENSLVKYQFCSQD